MFLNNNREEIMENKKEPEVTLEDLKDTTSKMFEIYEIVWAMALVSTRSWRNWRRSYI